ncbi:tRNA (adenosine(37)-N6)-threonylcarbamoyltransferase complex dimerization subunit type 1 TsaB [Candidatus Dependentiae bacterium]
MTKFLCVQHTYNGIEAAVFKNRTLIEKKFEDKKKSSKLFVAMVQDLLKCCNCRLDDLSFIAANKGPGPFTTLRVVLASVNGLALSTQKPLIGVDGLDALLQEYRNPEYPRIMTVALLDAYSKDVYFGIAREQELESQKGYRNIFAFLENLKKTYDNQEIYFIGNGSQKYQQEIVSFFGDKAILDTSERFIQNCSIESVGKMAFEGWEQRLGLTDQLLPVYLKSTLT